jgi:hypothetical protein
MGIWNAHTSVGNILGTVIAAALLSWVSLPGLMATASHAAASKAGPAVLICIPQHVTRAAHGNVNAGV